MSGPKRADVQAVLSRGAAIRQRCVARLGESKDAVNRSVMSGAESAGKQARAAVANAQKGATAFTPDDERLGGNVVRDARGALDAAAQAAKEADQAVAAAEKASARLRDADAAANRGFREAEKALETAQAALARADPHKIHGFYTEKAQADQAEQALASAERAAEGAKAIRDEVASQAQRAQAAANRAREAAQAAEAGVETGRREIAARRRAEAEAKAIAERKLAEATQAHGEARAVLAALAESPHDKFRPGRLAELERRLSEAATGLAAGRAEASRDASVAIQAEAGKLRTEVAQAAREFELRRSAAEAALATLEATRSSVDDAVIRAWSEDAAALEGAATAANAAKAAMEAEQFDDAVLAAREATTRLEKAFEDALESHAKDERRKLIGEAVMDALEELNFVVSSADGTLREPLKIGAQTVSGKGDVDIHIPLSGEVGFKVENTTGSNSCHATVLALQAKLREKGVSWETTDWGTAETPTETGGTVRQVQETEEIQQTQTQQRR